MNFTEDNGSRITLDIQSDTMQGDKNSAKFDINENGSLTEKTKTNYHQQRLGQSKWAFRLSLWGSIAGFVIIVWSIKQGIDSGNAQWPGIVSGVAIEGVSALFYNLSNKANEKISEFFIELTKDANIKNAIGLSDQITNAKIKDELKVKLSLYLVGIDEEKICKNTKEICGKENNSNS